MAVLRVWWKSQALQLDGSVDHRRFMEQEHVGAALAAYYEANGFLPPDENRRWEFFKVGPIPIVFPNTRARTRAIRLHDLHHLATGYRTDLRGEAEQSAWELAAGCHHHWFAWAINLSAIPMGLLLAPIRTWRAFRRGRACKTLYVGEFEPVLLELRLSELRSRLGLGDDAH